MNVNLVVVFVAMTLQSFALIRSLFGSPDASMYTFPGLSETLYGFGAKPLSLFTRIPT